MKSTCLLVKHPLNHGFSSPLAAFSFCQKSMGFFRCEILAPILPYPRATRGVKSVKSVDENDERSKNTTIPPYLLAIIYPQLVGAALSKKTLFMLKSGKTIR